MARQSWMSSCCSADLLYLLVLSFPCFILVFTLLPPTGFLQCIRIISLFSKGDFFGNKSIQLLTGLFEKNHTFSKVKDSGHLHLLHHIALPTNTLKIITIQPSH